MQDRALPRLVTWFMGGITLIGLSGGMILTFHGKELPQGLLAVIAGAGGSLGTLLTSLGGGMMHHQQQLPKSDGKTKVVRVNPALAVEESKEPAEP